ncbi:TPA: hypothetical protein ACH3X1_009345 [Trebouxia sp. C0004]
MHRSVLTMQQALLYFQALKSQNQGKYLPAVHELLSLHVCARCCLRFAGIRDKTYSSPSPASHVLLAAITDTPHQRCLISAKASGAEPQDAANHTFATNPPIAQQPSPVPCSAQSAEPIQLATDADHRHHSPTTATHATNQAPTNVVHGVVCPACLGALQAPEGCLQAVPSAVLAGLPEAEGNAGSWQTCTSGSVASLSQHVSQEGHVATNTALDITLPAACITRQLSIWYHLQTKFSGQGLYTSAHMFQEVVDLKEALRLTVATPLAHLMGVQAEREGDLRVMLAYLHPSSSAETDFLFIHGGGAKGRGYKRKRGQPKVIYAGRSASETVMQQATRLNRSFFLQHCPCPAAAPAIGIQLAYRVWRKPLYVAGRYLKLLRGVAQSPWIIDGQRKGVSSVEERIADAVLPAFQADRHKFMSAGREDFDVRMLGSGRPFVLEIINARAAVPPQGAFDAMQLTLEKEDHGVQVQALQPVPRSICSLLKAGEAEKQKSYTAICQLPTAVTPEMTEIIDSTKNLELDQQTPVRVSHRRADLVRHRTVYAMSCELVPGSPRHLVLRLRTQAGTYIKEFVHSDEGRTQPHLASLLGLSTSAAILQLDVNQIHIDFLQQ